MQLHELKPLAPKKTAKRIGRGGKRGKTSGKGHKGQKARAGNSTRPEMRDIIKKLPKLRGHGVNRARTVNAEKELPVVVNVAALETAFEAGATVTPKALVAAGVLSATAKRAPKVKILGNGELKKKLVVEDCQVSQSAKAKIEAAGGSVK
ncbi:50S ribosomal protein L15 [Candidatus Kaiserbacteria bacterium]|nr:50S ribosomal protein L15 [Candidatus Kaiserbacteria bacterium]USN88345.1 MAG: 50S ribosomal protein L15 [Candidatus Nomurabacteria bacterium]